MLYLAFDSFNTVAVENVVYQDTVACVASFTAILCGSLLTGVVFGLSAGLMSRLTSHVIIIEPLVVFAFGFMSFLSAELFHLSGILSYVSFSITDVIWFNIIMKSLL